MLLPSGLSEPAGNLVIVGFYPESKPTYILRSLSCVSDREHSMYQCHYMIGNRKLNSLFFGEFSDLFVWTGVSLSACFPYSSCWGMCSKSLKRWGLVSGEKHCNSSNTSNKL